jgi:hypothetical protein
MDSDSICFAKSELAIGSARRTSMDLSLNKERGAGASTSTFGAISQYCSLWLAQTSQLLPRTWRRRHNEVPVRDVDGPSACTRSRVDRAVVSISQISTSGPRNRLRRHASHRDGHETGRAHGTSSGGAVQQPQQRSVGRNHRVPDQTRIRRRVGPHRAEPSHDVSAIGGEIQPSEPDTPDEFHFIARSRLTPPV